MKKHEKSVKKNKNKTNETMEHYCDGQTEFSDCCSEMRRMWEQLHEMSQEQDVKHKKFNGGR